MLNQDYRDILSLLRENNVDFLLIGAYALAVYGFPRATADLDIFVKPTPENAKLVMRALVAFGAPTESISAEDFSHPGTIVQIGVAPRRIDVLTQIDGMSFEEAVHGKQEIQFQDLTIPVISKENLIANKLATGREQDRLDAEKLRNS